MVQWTTKDLGLTTQDSMEGVDSICGQGNEIPEAVWHGQKKKKKEKKRN